MRVFALLLLLVGAESIAQCRPRAGMAPGMCTPAAPTLGDFEFLPARSSWAECEGTGLVGSRGEAITFTRSSTATCVTTAGVVSTLTANQPRLEQYGLLVELAGTNNALRSEAFDHAAWSKDNATAAAPVVTADLVAAPDGTTTADRIVFPAVSGATDLSVVSQGNLVPGASSAGTPYTVSVWLKGASGGEQVYLFSRAFNSDFPASPTLCTLTTSWVRYTFSWLGTVGIFYGVSIGTNRNDPSQSATAAGTVYAWGAQFETTQVGASSYIATAGTAVTRTAEVITTPLPLVTADTVHSFGARVRFRKTGGTQALLTLGTISSAANASVLYKNVSDKPSYNVRDAAAATLTFTATASVVVATNYRLRALYSSGTMSIDQDGAAAPGAITGTGTGIIGTMPTTLTIGSASSAGASALNGWIRDVCIGNSTTECQ